ncbi:MAG: helix-turn-helix domain-containing protein [Clostridia bacterium]
MDEWGKIDLKLDEYLKAHSISRSSLSRNGQIHYKQLLKYCNNDMQKVDLNLLARICKTIDCEIGDIIEYTPPKENTK